MERDAIIGHGISDFLRESLMKRADGYTTILCNGCGTIPIYNEKDHLYICPMCDGPIGYIGDTANTLEIIPPMKRSVVSFSKVEIPYAFKVLEQEMNAYLNMGMRVLTTNDVEHFRKPPIKELTADQQRVLLEGKLPDRILPETEIPEFLPEPEEPEVRLEDLEALGAIEKEPEPERKTQLRASDDPGVFMKMGNMNLMMSQPQMQQQMQQQMQPLSQMQQMQPLSQMQQMQSMPQMYQQMQPQMQSMPQMQFDDSDTIPYSDASQPPYQQSQPPYQQSQQGVNVQTSSLGCTSFYATGCSYADDSSCCSRSSFNNCSRYE